jgi:hypothetical protein
MIVPVKFALETWKDKFEASNVQFTYEIVYQPFIHDFRNSERNRRHFFFFKSAKLLLHIFPVIQEQRVEEQCDHSVDLQDFVLPLSEDCHQISKSYRKCMSWLVLQFKVRMPPTGPNV